MGKGPGAGAGAGEGAGAGAGATGTAGDGNGTGTTLGGSDGPTTPLHDAEQDPRAAAETALQTWMQNSRRAIQFIVDAIVPRLGVRSCVTSWRRCEDVGSSGWIRAESDEPKASGSKPRTSVRRHSARSAGWLLRLDSNEQPSDQAVTSYANCIGTN